MKTNFKSTFLALIAFTALTFVSCDEDNNNNADTPEVVENPIAEIASETPELSILVEALSKAGLVSTFQNPGNYTVFAPNNDAFIAAGFTSEVIASLTAQQVQELKEILLNHVIIRSLRSSELEDNSYIKTLAKGSASTTNTLSMHVSKTNVVKLNGISTVIAADIVAGNGVVHVVDKVITLPTIATHAIANPSFSTLVSLLAREGQPNFAEVLSNPGTYTVFAPVNDAFTALDAELPGGLASLSPDQITKVLQYHVVGGANVLSTALTDGMNVTPILTPSQTFSVLLSGGPRPRILDAAGRQSNIVFTNVQCTNGVVHVIDGVLVPAL